MRRLVLVCLVAVAASQAAGCIISSGDDGDDVGDFGFITANWSFQEVGGATLGCPTGFQTAEVTATPVDGTPGPVVIDLYDCAAFTGRGDYDLGSYDVFITITDDASVNVYAESLTQTVDITVNDATVTETIIDDGGRFVFDWSLVDAATNAPLNCAEAGNPDAIEISSTLSGPNTLTTDQFECSDLTGLTDPLIAGSYVVSVAALNAAGGALGAPQNQNTTITAPNGLTDLGVFELPID
jgi:hypothetical protein